jgi:hypothetical protein
MLRITVYVIVEGQTENAVLNKLLGTHLGAMGIDLHCPIVKLGIGRGGVKWLRFEEFSEQIQRFLKDRRTPVVTTFFDYYGLPFGEGRGWDFVQKAKTDVGFRGLDVTVKSIEDEIHRLVTEGLDLPNVKDRFMPYIQLHELEALFFAEPDKLANVFENAALEQDFVKAVTDCGGCEKINDSPQTAPSKRINAAFPKYIKGRSDLAHGPRLAEKLDLVTVREACPRFDAWVSKLENLAPQDEEESQPPAN